jgi:hypothetical protein
MLLDKQNLSLLLTKSRIVTAQYKVTTTKGAKGGEKKKRKRIAADGTKLIQ